MPGPGRLGLPFRGVTIHVDDFEWPWTREPRTPTFEESTVPPPLGERGTEDILIKLIIDQSASELFTDPHGYRMIAARRILHLLRTELKHKGDRMDVCHFSEIPAPRVGPPAHTPGKGAAYCARPCGP